MTAPCHCACHQHPGIYPTSPARPCSTCGHFDADGELLGGRETLWFVWRIDPYEHWSEHAPTAARAAELVAERIGAPCVLYVRPAKSLGDGELYEVVLRAERRRG